MQRLRARTRPATTDRARRTISIGANACSSFPSILGRLASKHPVGEGRVGENDRCDDRCSDQQEAIVLRRGCSGPETQAERHDVGEDGDAEARDSEGEQGERQSEGPAVRAAAAVTRNSTAMNVRGA